MSEPHEEFCLPPTPREKRELEQKRQRELAAPAGYALSLPPDPGFDCWWSMNHTFDWWAKEREGEPLPHGDRLRVWAICRRAWDAAHND